MDPPPVFIGGTGRSGTTITARLIGKHSRYFFVPFELRFHAERKGLPGVIRGSQTPEGFVQLMRGRWHPENRRGRLFRRLVEPGEYERAVAEFERTARDAPVQAGRRLVKSILDPQAKLAGKQGWVEMTPVNVVVAPALLELFPEMKLIHVVRDGRDVACSVSQRWQGDVDSALGWWERRLRAAHLRTRGLRAERLQVIWLEDLVQASRERTFTEVLDFLGLDAEAGIRHFFDSQVTDPNSSIGRWRRNLEPPLRRRINDRYESMLEGLARDGVLTPRAE